jgi:hypothetical protein
MNIAIVVSVLVVLSLVVVRRSSLSKITTNPTSLLRISCCCLVLCFGATGCGGNWQDFNYGPGDWLAENSGVPIDSIYEGTYDWIVDPQVEVVPVSSDDLATYCGISAVFWGSRGCEVHNTEWSKSTIYVSTKASPAVIAHEKKHSRGWCHYPPRYDEFHRMTEAERNREISRARGWYVCPSLSKGGVKM